MIPNRIDTLRVLRLMDAREPLLMLLGDADGFGTRWTLSGQQVEPAIARYLMNEGFIAEIGSTELGAMQLGLTPAGTQFCHDGFAWWAGLNLFQKLQITLWG